MFPGQGSQYVGMGKSLLTAFGECQRVFEEAEDITKLRLRRLCFEGPAGELQLTVNTQPCILTVSVATFLVVKNRLGLEPTLFAGHSLGEYSALVASEKMVFADALEMVKKRGEAMQRAVPVGEGAMAAVLRCPAAQLEGYCREHSTQGEFVEIVNYNSEAQLVVAGHTPAVTRLCQFLADKDIKAPMLPVSAPFHSKLMAKAADEMQPILSSYGFCENENLIIPNLTAEITKNYTANYLIDQISSPVLWMQTIKAALDAKADTLIEFGPGKVLLGLARRSFPKGTGGKIFATDDIEGALAAIGAHLKA